MPRAPRSVIGGYVYHLFNRAKTPKGIFRKSDDYQTFIELLLEGKQHADIELFGFCVMPDHWHLIVRPAGDFDMSTYLAWITNTHVKRYRSAHPRTSGPLYHGRYKSFPVEESDPFLNLMRYIEANPVRAHLAERAQQWEWSSLGCDKSIGRKLLNDWPVDRPRNWAQQVNKPMSDSMMEPIKTSLQRGRPLGSTKWVLKVVKQMGLQQTLNPRGRPRLPEEEE